MPLFCDITQYRDILRRGEVIIDCREQPPIRLVLPSPIIEGPEFNLHATSPQGDRLVGFAKEYESLCRRYGLQISSCGCCNSPWIEGITENLYVGNNLDVDDIVQKVTAYCEKENI